MKDMKKFIKTTIREFLNEQINNSIKWVKPDFKTEEGEFTGHFFHWMVDDVLQIDFETYSDEFSNQQIANDSYAVADAMMKARNHE